MIYYFPAFKLSRLSVKLISDYIRQKSSATKFNSGSWTVLSAIEQSIKAKVEKSGKPLKYWDINIYRGILTGYNEAFIIDTKTRDRLVAASPKNAEIIRPILRGRDIQKYKAEWAGLYILDIHTGYKNQEGDIIKPIDIDNYPIIKEYMDKYYSQLSVRQDKGITPYHLRSCIYMEDFSKHKIVWKRIGSVIRFSYDDSGAYCLDSTCFATGKDIKFLVGYLNSILSNRELLNNAPKTGTGDVITSVQALEPLIIPMATDDQKIQISSLVDESLVAISSNNYADLHIIEAKINNIFFDILNLDQDEISRLTYSLTDDFI